MQPPRTQPSLGFPSFPLPFSLSFGGTQRGLQCHLGFLPRPSRLSSCTSTPHGAELCRYMARTHSALVPNNHTPSQVSSKPQRHPPALSSSQPHQLRPSYRVSPTCEDFASSLYTKLLLSGPLHLLSSEADVPLRACLSRCQLIKHLSTSL